MFSAMAFRDLSSSVFQKLKSDERAQIVNDH